MSDTPKVEINLNGVTPNLAKGLVEAQEMATTVESQGQGHGYRYPTQADITCKARQAMSVGRLSLIRIHYVLQPVVDWLKLQQMPTCMVVSTYVLMHESGDSLPPIKATTPVFPNGRMQLDKAVNAALTIGHKYILAGLFNMGWVDPSEDVDQRDDQKFNPPKPLPPQVKLVAPKTPYDVLRDLCVKATAWLKTKDIDVHRAYQLATGCDGNPEKGMPPSKLMAIVQLRQTTESLWEEVQRLPEDHTTVYQWRDIKFVESPMLWVGGTITLAGTAFDHDFKNGQYSPENHLKTPPSVSSSSPKDLVISKEQSSEATGGTTHDPTTEVVNEP